MAWHTITHSCGHEDRHQLYGPGRTRTWRAERLADEPCEACKTAAREAENAAAAAANREAGLPALTGTEKQIAWAETIRAHKLDILARVLSGELTGYALAAYWDGIELDDPDLPLAIDALQSQSAAHWWIDHRDRKVSALLELVARDLAPTLPPAIASAPAAVDALAEATLRPEQEQTATVAEVNLDGNRIKILFPEKREDFRALVKAKGYHWGDASRPTWVRVIDQWSGPIADRAAEIGNTLLAAGFLVRIHDPAIRAAAVAATFAPERKRWVRARLDGAYAGWLVLSWARDDDLYADAKALRGSRYDKPYVVVPATQYAAIEDFADAYDLAISQEARDLLDAARTAHDQAVLATPAKARKAPKVGTGPMPAATGAIDPALLDDDSGSEYAMLHGDSQS